MVPELAALTTTLSGIATPNTYAQNLVPRELRDDDALFPNADTLARCHPIRNLGAQEPRLASAWP